MGTRKKRQAAYEEKVRQVRQAQLRLMEHHSKARRVGMRDVSKKRASKIHKAHNAKHKKEQKELKERAKEEKKLNKMHKKQSHDDAPGSQYAAIPEYGMSGSGHKRINSKAELELYRTSNASRDQHRSSQAPQYAASATGAGGYRPPRQSQRVSGAQSVYSAHSDAPLPPNWKVYFNEDKVPYYYNTNTGQTTWRHPGSR